MVFPKFGPGSVACDFVRCFSPAPAAHPTLAPKASPMDWSRKAQPDGNGGSIEVWYLDVPGPSLDDALLERAFLSVWAAFVTHVVPSHSHIEWDCCRAPLSTGMAVE